MSFAGVTDGLGGDAALDAGGGPGSGGRDSECGVVVRLFGVPIQSGMGCNAPAEAHQVSRPHRRSGGRGHLLFTRAFRASGCGLGSRSSDSLNGSEEPIVVAPLGGADGRTAAVAAARRIREREPAAGDVPATAGS
jgi:hypothetical protein